MLMTGYYSCLKDYERRENKDDEFCLCFLPQSYSAYISLVTIMGVIITEWLNHNVMFCFRLSLRQRF